MALHAVGGASELHSSIDALLDDAEYFEIHSEFVDNISSYSSTSNLHVDLLHSLFRTVQNILRTLWHAISPSLIAIVHCLFLILFAIDPASFTMLFSLPIHICTISQSRVAALYFWFNYSVVILLPFSVLITFACYMGLSDPAEKTSCYA